MATQKELDLLAQSARTENDILKVLIGQGSYDNMPVRFDANVLKKTIASAVASGVSAATAGIQMAEMQRQDEKIRRLLCPPTPPKRDATEEDYSAFEAYFARQPKMSPEEVALTDVPEEETALDLKNPNWDADRHPTDVLRLLANERSKDGAKKRVVKEKTQSDIASRRLGIILLGIGATWVTALSLGYVWDSVLGGFSVGIIGSLGLLAFLPDINKRKD